MNDSYRTITSQVQVRVPVGACRFIASLSPAASEKEAREQIEAVSREFSDANHNAYAYKVGFKDSAIRRCSDAGEPASTAGPPMLDVLDKYDLTHVVVVGTRYFGGVKLGVGGLVRAYRACAEEGVKSSTIKTRYFTRSVSFEVSYEHMGSVLREIESIKGTIKGMEYDSRVIITVELREKFYSPLLKSIRDAARGDVIVMQREENNYEESCS